MEWYLKTRTPLVLGHEPSGVVAKVGSRVEGFAVGDRVFAHHHVACLTCHYCRHGEYTLCEQFAKTHLEPGGFAEYFRVPAPNLQIDTLKIPPELSPTVRFCGNHGRWAFRNHSHYALTNFWCKPSYRYGFC